MVSPRQSLLFMVGRVGAIWAVLLLTAPVLSFAAGLPPEVVIVQHGGRPV